MPKFTTFIGYKKDGLKSGKINPYISKVRRLYSEVLHQ
jgi:hypothetical protein